MKITEKISFGIQIPRDQFSSISEIVNLSLLVEKNGFDSVWLEDHLVEEPIPKWYECFTCLTVIGLQTKNLLVGSLVTDHLRRHPATLAQTAGTISDITSGRMILGIGAGEAYQLLPLGIPSDQRVTGFKEALDIIHLIWTSGNTDGIISYHGKHFRLNKLPNMPLKPDYVPALYVAAFGAEMLKITGSLGDGWLPFAHTPESYNHDLQVILASGRHRDVTFNPACVLISSLAENRLAAYEQVDKVAKRHMLWVPSVRSTLGLTLPKDLSLAHLNKLDARTIERLDEYATRFPDEVAIRSVIAGNSENWIDQIDEFVKMGMRHIVFRIEHPITSKIPSALRIIGSEVLPYFRRRE